MFHKKTRYRIVDLKQLGIKSVGYTVYPFIFRAQVYARKGWGWKWTDIGDIRCCDYPLKRVGPPEKWTEVQDRSVSPEETRAYKQAQLDIIRHIRSGSSAIVAEYDIDEAAKLEAAMVKEA